MWVQHSDNFIPAGCSLAFENPGMPETLNQLLSVASVPRTTTSFSQENQFYLCSL